MLAFKWLSMGFKDHACISDGSSLFLLRIPKKTGVRDRQTVPLPVFLIAARGIPRGFERRRHVLRNDFFVSQSIWFKSEIPVV